MKDLEGVFVSVLAERERVGKMADTRNGSGGELAYPRSPCHLA